MNAGPKTAFGGKGRERPSSCSLCRKDKEFGSLRLIGIYPGARNVSVNEDYRHGMVQAV